MAEIRLDEDTRNKEGKTLREFAFLDSMLVANAPVELAETVNRV